MTGSGHAPTLRARRLPRAAVALALLLLATLAPSVVAPPDVNAASCTGWRSSSVPPTTIRVLRTHGPSAGRVQTVNFRTYVNTVMPAEWGPTHPREALRAGAVAIKQYAWYHAMYWRGRSATGGCYDVVDSTNDQVYSPETKRPSPVHISAVDATWGWSMLRNGRFFPSGYRAGAKVACGADSSGTVMYQNGASRCARDGKTATEILMIYYGRSVEVRGDVDAPAVAATPKPTPTPTPTPAVPSGLAGDGDSTGDAKGDVIVVTAPDDPTMAETMIYPSGTVPAGGGPVKIALAQPPADTLARASADVSGDGLDDLAALIRTPDGALRLEVALAVAGGALAPPVLWWQGGPGDLGWAEGAPIRFVLGDVDGDGNADALVLVGAANPAEPVTIWQLPSTGTSFGPPAPWWVGLVAVENLVVIAADVDADARDDIIFQTDLANTFPPGTGIRFSVLRAAAVLADGLASPAESWLDLPDVSPGIALVAVSDVNRDRRLDLVLARPVGTTGIQLVGLLSAAAGGFTRETLWENAGSFRWSASQVAGADVDGDGRGDIVIMYNLGAGGTRFFRFISNGSTLRSAGSTTDPTLVWAGTAIY